MKRIVTHISPDIDALAAVWLVKRFLPKWKHADVEFVSAGLTFNGMKPDSDPDTIHVDTGGGKFDHHETADYTCAARLVFDYLLKRKCIKDTDREAVERIVDVITRYDHFQEALLADPDDDMHAFSLAYVVIGLRADPHRAQKLVELTGDALDGILQYMKNKVHAEEVLLRGFTFTSKWGKTIAIETDNEKAMKIGFFQGYDMIIRYSPHYKNASIKLHTKSKKNLKKVHTELTKKDPEAQWFYHASGRMLMNASTRDNRERVTKFSAQELIKLVQSF
jgi:hypothetical protein